MSATTSSSLMSSIARLVRRRSAGLKSISTVSLVRVLCRHLGITKADDDVHRLALCIVAQAVFLYMGRDVLLAVRPRLMGSPAALDVMGERLTEYALALVQAEQKRRKKEIK